jgi:lipopolysaccharide/colanic/teichoic acid biosynthesis glycosyltransferase
VRTFEEVLDAQRAVLGKKVTGLMLTGREADPGIWISRNVRLHPTAQLLAPVYIGENCNIASGVRLGPDAVIGKDCVLDTHCTVTNSLVFPGSYVGEALELADVLVDKNRLINARLGGTVPVTDDFILGGMSDRHLVPWVTRMLSRLTGLVLLVLAAPVLLVTFLCLKAARRGPVLSRREVVRLPTSPEERDWRTFRLWSFGPEADLCSFQGLLQRFLPALVNVAGGDLSFVGVPPRSREEVRQLSHDWRALYLRAKPGIVTEAAVRYPGEPDEDEKYAAEAFYVVTAGWRYDLKLLLRYFGRLLFGFRRPVREEQEAA